jgi:hypothetical protein
MIFPDLRRKPMVNSSDIGAVAGFQAFVDGWKFVFAGQALGFLYYFPKVQEMLVPGRAAVKSLASAFDHPAMQTPLPELKIARLHAFFPLTQIPKAPGVIMPGFKLVFTLYSNKNYVNK